MGIACNWERLHLLRVEAMESLRPRNRENCSWGASVKGGELGGQRASSRICFTEGEGVSALGRLLFVACVRLGGFGWGSIEAGCYADFFPKKQKPARHTCFSVTLAFTDYERQRNRRGTGYYMFGSI